VNDTPHLFETDPSGAFTEFTAGAIGMGKRDVEKLLEERYKPGMSRQDAISMALVSLNSVSEGKIQAENVDMITIEMGGKYAAVQTEEIRNSIKLLGKELEHSEKKE
jgi:proteasome alpha subunit